MTAAPHSVSSENDRATQFAAAVRARLSDLPAEELDELLDGLHADLSDRLADGQELGDPESYAEELRQAAGLPERKPDTEAERLTVAQRLNRLGNSLVAWADRTPVRRGLRDFFLSLRPLWWVVRGMVVAVVAAWIFGASLLWQPAGSIPFMFFMLFMLCCIVVSVQWGRGAWAPKRWLVWLRRAASVGAVLALLPVTALAWGQLNTQHYAGGEYGPQYVPGLALNGTEIGNIFAYDCSGQPLEGVQLFTRDGDPLTTLQDGESPYFYDSTDQGYRYARSPFASLPNGWSGWNVFPLQQILDQGNGETDADGNPIGVASPAPLPFAQVPAVSDACPAEPAETDSAVNPDDEAKLGEASKDQP